MEHTYLAAEDPRVKRVELTISYLLRIGVICSEAIVLAGIAATLWHHRSWFGHTTDVRALIDPARQDVPTNLGTVVAGVQAHEPQAIVMLGLLVLISTPVLRVAVSALLFAFQRDWVFTAITVIVLAFLSLSFLLGKAGG